MRAVIGMVLIGVVNGVLLAAAACGSKAKQEPVENHARAEGPPPATSPAEEAIAKLDAFTHDMCACKDKACADRVQAAMNAWSTEQARRKAPPGKPTEEEMKRMTEVAQRYGECMTTAYSVP